MEICKNCRWFVNDDDKSPEDYQHEIAVKKNEGFCLLQPLFTDVMPDQKACNRFFNDREI